MNDAGDPKEADANAVAQAAYAAVQVLGAAFYSLVSLV